MIRIVTFVIVYHYVIDNARYTVFTECRLMLSTTIDSVAYSPKTPVKYVMTVWLYV